MVCASAGSPDDTIKTAAHANRRHACFKCLPLDTRMPGQGIRGPHLPAAIRCSGAKLGAVSLFRILYQRHRDELLIVLRKLAMHETASPAWRATAGHISTPTSLTPAPACARTAAAVQLYSSIAATNPRRARLGPSSRASQQAPPNESSAAPAIRPTTNAADESSDTPSS